MLRDYVEKLCAELAIEKPKPNARKNLSFKLSDAIDVALQDLEPGVSMQAPISPLPLKKREDLFLYLMRANLLGQGTGGARIGLDESEKILTLSLGLPYEMNYQLFREQLEDFVNYLTYWREEIMKFEKEER